MKSTVKRMKKVRNGEKIFAKYIFDKGLAFTTYQELMKVNNEKANKPIFKKGAKDQDRYLTKDIRMEN